MLRHNTLLIICFFSTLASRGQDNDVWVRFIDTTKNLSGYKDLRGNIRIPAKFATYASADSFYNIIGVVEQGERYQSYYLLKDGTIVGRDSLFSFDFTTTCESEGKILFYDRSNKLAGYLDKKGAVIIPAMYNWATPFRNGMALALKHAVETCLDDDLGESDCEHCGLYGGETVLINDKNEILADNVNGYLDRINWYSMRINDPTVDTAVYFHIKGRNGNTYSFVDYRKEFTQWFYSDFLPAAHTKNTERVNFPDITYWKNGGDWISIPAATYLKSHPDLFAKERFQENTLTKVSIGSDNLYLEEGINKRYYNACGEHNEDRYPAFSVRVAHYKKRTKPYVKPVPDPSFPVIAGATYEAWEPSEFDKKYEVDYDEEFGFIRTEKGYQLHRISVQKR